MAPSTKPRPDRTDSYGIERTRQDDPGVVDKIRAKSDFVDHLMRMQERYGSEGGNQFAAGITYFSVLAIFPIFLLLVAAAATVLANRPDLFEQLQEQIMDAVDGDLGVTINEVLETAVAQRGAMFGVGGLTTLWSGLAWMNHLRVGISAMWGIDANDGGNFFFKKLSDLIRLVGLLLTLIVAFLITALATSGAVPKIFEWVGIETFPGMDLTIQLVGLVAGLLANFVVMWWLLVILPRTKVPKRSGLAGTLVGVIALEILKRASTAIVASASGSPAGAVFGPVIVLMVVMYLLWRVVLYLSAFTATTEESLAEEETPAPDPAVIRVRAEAATERPATGLALGAGAAIGASAAAVLAVWRGRRR